MAKEIKQIVKLQIIGGEAKPAPPIGTALGPTGINLQQFVQTFNAKTSNRKGELIPTIVTIYKDRTFDIAFKVAPVSFMVKKAINLEKGSATPNKTKVGKITKKQVKEIAAKKLPDLNTKDIEKAAKIVEGTCKSMGIEVVD